MVSVGPYLLPVVAMLGAFAIVITAMVLRGKALDRQHRERMFLAEKGLDVPKELYDAREPLKPKTNDYKAGRAWLIILGMLLVFIGIGVMIALGVSEGMRDGINGVIPLLIGISLLAAERMIRRAVVKRDSAE